MHDPHEGVTSKGTIQTGAKRDRVVAAFEPALEAGALANRIADRDRRCTYTGRWQPVRRSQVRPAWIYPQSDSVG